MSDVIIIIIIIIIIIELQILRHRLPL